MSWPSQIVQAFFSESCYLQASQALLRCSRVKDMVEKAAEVLSDVLERPVAFSSVALDLSMDSTKAPAAYQNMCFVRSHETSAYLRNWVIQQQQTPEAIRRQAELNAEAAARECGEVAEMYAEAQQQAGAAAQQQCDTQYDTGEDEATDEDEDEGSEVSTESMRFSDDEVNALPGECNPLRGSGRA